MKNSKEIKIIDCECNGSSCCGGRGIAVFEAMRDGKKINVCTRCDLSTDKSKKILKYVKNIPTEKLMNFDPLGAFCLMSFIKDKTYEFTND